MCLLEFMYPVCVSGGWKESVGCLGTGVRQLGVAMWVQGTKPAFPKSSQCS